MAKRRTAGTVAPNRQQAKRCLLPALEPTLPQCFDALHDNDIASPAGGCSSPYDYTSVDPEVHDEICRAVDDFVLQLPLGSDAAAAEVEAAVAIEMVELHLGNTQLKQRLFKWMNVAQELQALVQQQQKELQQQQLAAEAPAATPAQQQLEAANAELRKQLQGATARLQDLEEITNRLMSQQSLGANLQSAQPVAEHDAANAAVADATNAATTAQQDAARLRRALLDAEIDTQRFTVAAETAKQRVMDLEAELVKNRSLLAATKSETEAERRKLAAAEAAAASSAAELLESRAALTQARAEAARAQHEAQQTLVTSQLQCNNCAVKSGQLVELQQELLKMKDSKGWLESAVAHEQNRSKELSAGLDDCKRELQQAKRDLKEVRANLREAEKAADAFYKQLYGCEKMPYDTPYSSSCCGEECIQAIGWVQGNETCGSPAQRAKSPLRGKWQQQQAPSYGFVQRCSTMQQQLQVQVAELASLRQQLLELQLQLADTCSSASTAQQQLQQATCELTEAKVAAASATAAAKAAEKLSSEQQQHLVQLQVQLAQQSPELAAAQAQVEKLQAQQRVWLNDVQQGLDAAAEASASEAAAAAKAVQLQMQLQELQQCFGTMQRQWKDDEAKLLADNATLVQRLTTAEAASKAALQQAQEEHQQQMELLRSELAADAARRADAGAKALAIKQQHAQQVRELQADMQQQQAQQQSLQQQLTDHRSQLQESASKLAAAGAALAAAQADAKAQSASALKQQQALRQQVLDLQKEKLQLQEHIVALQRRSGESQELQRQVVAAQQAAAAQQVSHRQQLHNLQQQVSQLQLDKELLEHHIVEAQGAKKAAAQQAAAAGERLAAAVAAQEAAKLQMSKVDAPRRSWELQQEQQQRHNMSPGWQQHECGYHQQQQQQDGKQGPAGSASIAYRDGSPIRAQLMHKDSVSAGLRQQLAERDSEVSELLDVLDQLRAESALLTAEHAQLRAENAQLTTKLKQLRAENAELDTEFEQLKVENAQLSEQLCKLNTDLHSQEQQQGREQQPQEQRQTVALASSDAPVASQQQQVQQVHTLWQTVRQLSSELTKKEALLEQLPGLQEQVSTLNQQLTQAQQEAADVAGLQQQLEDLQAQLATAKVSEKMKHDVANKSRPDGEAAADNTAMLHQLLQELSSLRAQLAAAEAARALGTDSAGFNSSGGNNQAVVQALQQEADGLRQQVRQLQMQLAAAQVSDNVSNQLSSELACCQHQFEQVVQELHAKHEELVAHRKQVAALEWQLAEERTAAEAQLSQLTSQLHAAHSEEAAVRSELVVAQQQLLQLQAELEQVRQQEAEHPTATTRQMQALLMQKDKDIRNLQQQLQEQQQHIGQLSGQQQQIEQQQQLEHTLWPSTAVEADGLPDSSRLSQTAGAIAADLNTAAAVVTDSNCRASINASNSRLRTSDTIHPTITDKSDTKQSSWEHGTAELDAAVSGASSSSSTLAVARDNSGQQLGSLTADNQQMRVQLLHLQSQQDASNKRSNVSSAVPQQQQQRRQQGAEGVDEGQQQMQASSSLRLRRAQGINFDPGYLERSLRSSSNGRGSNRENSPSGSRGHSDPGNAAAADGDTAKIVSRAARRVQSFGPKGADAASIAHAASRAITLITGAVREGAVLRPSRISGVPNRPSRHSNTNAAADWQEQQQEKQQHSLNRSPSRRAAASLAARGLSKLPSGSSPARNSRSSNTDSRSSSEPLQQPPRSSRDSSSNQSGAAEMPLPPSRLDNSSTAGWDQTGALQHSSSNLCSKPGSRAKLLTISSGGGYDADKLRRSLSGNTMQQQQVPEVAAGQVGDSAAARRLPLAAGAASRAARVAGVMSGARGALRNLVSFKEPVAADVQSAGMARTRSVPGA